MANTRIGTFGDPNTSGIELRDHNEKVELIPIGQFDYAMLSYEDAAALVKALAAFLNENDAH